MLVNNLQTVHQHHSACSSKLLCLFSQLVLKLCYVTPYSMPWMGKGSHRPIICYSSLQSMLGHCLPCYESEGFIALLWLMHERQKDPDAKNRSKARHFSLTVKSQAWRRKSTLSVMTLPGNIWWEGITRTADLEDVSYKVTPGFALAGKGESKSQDESKQGILIPHTPGE